MQQRAWLLVFAFGCHVLACDGNRQKLERSTPNSERVDPNSEVTDAGSELRADGGEPMRDAGMRRRPRPARDAGSDASEPEPNADADGRPTEDAGQTKSPQTRMALPNGSRELDGIVNLVDGPAAEQLEHYIVDYEELPVTQKHGLTLPVNLFLTHYPEEYDFLYFITDHEISTGTVVGRYEDVNSPALPGGTLEVEVQASGYRTTGRLKGVIGIRYRPIIYPPLGHETLHHWATFLDARFGFGQVPGDPHWGLASVNGVLGGFDPASLRCETPAGAQPPSCEELPNGRTRYVLNSFHPNDNTGRSSPYAPLELYLMGLIPGSQVPSEFLVFDEGDLDESTRSAESVVVEAMGLKTVELASIIERHGMVPRLAEDQRKFRAAFAVISAQPASEEVLREVAKWAAVFGNRMQVEPWLSFESYASGLASMDTKLGDRRAESDKVPDERAELRCDVLKQDCPRAELGCYEYFPAVCALSGKLALGQTCDATFSCAPGLECMTDDTGSYKCASYCDPSAAQSQSDKACAKLCSGKYIELQDNDGQVMSAICRP